MSKEASPTTARDDPSPQSTSPEGRRLMATKLALIHKKWPQSRRDSLAAALRAGRRRRFPEA